MIGSKSRGRGITAILLATSAIALATSAYAQIDEVVVTATKRGDTNLQDLGMSAVAIDESTLELMGAEEFTDFSRSVPGLDVIDVGPGQKRYLMRGVSGPGEATVGLYYDNIPLTGNGEDAAAVGGNQPDLDLFDSQRVEVLRGPQGTLYGASSVSGVVRVVTNKPQFDAVTGRIQMDAAGRDRGDGTHSAKGMINIPFADQFAVRATAYYTYYGGFIDNAVLGKDPSCYVRGDSIGLGIPEIVLNPATSCDDGIDTYVNINDITKTGGRLHAQWNPTDQSSLLFSWFTQNTESGGRNAFNPIDSEYFLGPPFIEGGNRFFTAAAGDYRTNVRGTEPYEDDLDIFALEYEQDFSAGSLTATLSRFDREVYTSIDSSSPARLHRRFYETPLGPWGGAAVSTTDRMLVPQDQVTEVTTFEARYASALDGSVNFITGLFYSDRDIGLHSLALVADPSTGALVPGELARLDRTATNDTTQLAWYGEVYWSLTDKWELMGGFRTFQTDREQTGFLAVPFMRSPILGGPPGPQPSTPESFSDTIFKAQVNFAPTEDYLFYLQASEGFRAGGVNAVIVPSIPPSFQHDNTINYEFGAKTTWLEGRLNVNFAAYRIDWDNLQMEANFTNQFEGLVNCTEQSNPVQGNGFELEITAAISDNWLLGLAGTTMDATWQVEPETCLPQSLLDTLSDPIGGFAGQKLVGVPDYSGTAYLQYDTPSQVFGGTDWYVRADVQFQGEVDVNEMRVTRNIENPSYLFGHLKFGVDWENWGAALYIRNVTNEVAHLSLFNNFQQENRVTVNPPRTIGITLDYRFSQ